MASRSDGRLRCKFPGMYPAAMQIHRLTAFQVPIALKKPVRHASHVRHRNDTIILRCVMDDGSFGWGEGLPRPYVTGESIESVWRHLGETHFHPLREQEFNSALEAALAVDRFELADVLPDEGVNVRECFGNAVRCAVEIAVIDAACRAEGCSVGAMILRLCEAGKGRAATEWRGTLDGDPGCSFPDAAPWATPRQEVFYSGAVTSMSPSRQWLSAIKMRLFGFRHVKVKVGSEGLSDVACLRRVRAVVGKTVDLRLDANEAWHCDDVARRMAPLMKFQPTSLEQPVAHAEVSGLRDVRSEINVPIMLDESLCSTEDAERAIAGGWCDLFNIRLSKCGGLVRSVRLAALARQHRLGYQLGCQVGETGILSAAGRHFACNIPDIRYLEGSFDRFLVRDALTEQDLTFNYGGRAGRLAGPGLGIDVDECRVRALAVRTMELIEPADLH